MGLTVSWNDFSLCKVVCELCMQKLNGSVLYLEKRKVENCKGDKNRQEKLDFGLICNA